MLYKSHSIAHSHYHSLACSFTTARSHSYLLTYSITHLSVHSVTHLLIYHSFLLNSLACAINLYALDLVYGSWRERSLSLIRRALVFNCEFNWGDW